MNIQSTPPPRSPISKAVHWLDDYTRPRPSTSGDLEENSYIQPMFHATSSGFAFMGLSGVAVAAGSAVAATFAARQTKSRAVAIAAGAVTGAVSASALAAATGSAPVGLATIVGGGLLGGLQAMRGDKEAEVRDASGNATMISGFFLPGTAKIAGAIGSGVGATQDNPWAAVAVGAATGAALGASLAAMGLSPEGMAISVGISAVAGGLGPLFGPRFSQFFRNFANDSGQVAADRLRKWGVPEEKLSEEMANSIGAFPSQFAKEGIRGFINSDFELSGLVVGGLIESAELIHLFWVQKKDPHGHHHHHHHHH